ncbi:hypothetical protein F5879DRAFT_179344 [Lentinula edodes]|uniref:Uncharacterized protein n=1 Tax=Lentinula edodes TaxID=5353 RepID=A0A1Q3EHQ3_LENED|nr:uncharacterized protein C8R40DRAFT_328785 [Lentinula edodes]KAH7874154.1 hypothetical protein C8R40DRAFT_328785 [Lentinula edodes]KAJ3903078.1 hypothetical protein F5879DRAFT_179344 [Lentinula edodes]GAW06715.1 hypothetical protein LENED_008659 [Lentinula edodes]
MTSLTWTCLQKVNEALLALDRASPLPTAHDHFLPTLIPRQYTPPKLQPYFISSMGMVYHPVSGIGWYDDLADHLYPQAVDELELFQEDTVAMTPSYQVDDVISYSFSNEDGSFPSLTYSEITPEEQQGISSLVPLLSSSDYLPDHRIGEIHRLQSAYEEYEIITSPEERAIVQATFNLLIRRKEEEDEQKRLREHERAMYLEQARLDLLNSCVLEVEAARAAGGHSFFPTQEQSFDYRSHTIECECCDAPSTEGTGEIPRCPPFAPFSPEPPYPSHDFLPETATWPPFAPSSSTLLHPSRIVLQTEAVWPPRAPPARMLPDPRLAFAEDPATWLSE